MKRYFEFKEDPSSKFWEITLEKNTITTRYGKIGTDGQSTTKTLATEEPAQKEFEKLVKAKLKKGYVEIAGEDQEEETAAPGYNVSVISGKEAIQRFELDRFFPGSPDGEPRYLLFEGDDVVFDRDLDVSQLCAMFSPGQQAVAGLIVAGNMIVAGKLLTSGMMLFVTGDLSAANTLEKSSQVVARGAIAEGQAGNQGTNAAEKDMWNTPFPYPYTIITEEEAMKRFKIDKNKYVHSSYGWDKNATYIFIDQDVSFPYDIETDALCQLLKKDHKKVDGIIIHGNVTIDGALLQLDAQQGERFFVNGNVVAKNILKGGAEFHIKGHVEVEQAIYGLYNHGMLVVEGDVSATFILEEDHYYHFSGNKTESIGQTGVDPLLPELQDNPQLIAEYMIQGKHIVQEKFLQVKNRISKVEFSALAGFHTGFSIGPEDCLVIAQAGEEENEYKEIPGDVLHWKPNTGWVRELSLDWMATAVAMRPNRRFEKIFVTGPSGIVAIKENDAQKEEKIESPGPINALKYIGDHLYAAGMGRQVYRCREEHPWKRMDLGVVQSLGISDTAGFNAIDGLNESDLYAVGDEGEVWRYYQASWKKLHSPTDRVLLDVKMIKPGEGYACGQNGTILKIIGDTITLIETNSEVDFLSLEAFKETVFVSTLKKLFTIKDDNIKEVTTNLPPDFTYGKLHHNLGALWSFGRRNICWTDNAKRWRDVTPGELASTH